MEKRLGGDSLIENIIKKHKVLTIIVILISLVFVFMNINHVLEIKRLKSEYETDMEKLREMIPETNTFSTLSNDDNVCDENIKEWLKYYYGVSEDVTKQFRDEQLSKLMTLDAYLADNKEYDIELGYEAELSDIQIFYKPKSETEKNICIFFTQNIIWPQVDPLVSKWYLTGNIVFEDDIWKMDEITQCDELITRDEYNLLQIDTNGSSLDE